MACSPVMGYAADLNNSSTSTYVEDVEGYDVTGEDTTQGKVSSKTGVYDVTDTTYANTFEAEVYATRNSVFSVIIPKIITLDGSTRRGDYQVAVKGDLSGNQELSVVPEDSVVLKEQNAGVDAKADVTGSITQAKTVWNQAEMDADEFTGTGVTTGVVSASGITAGSWAGTFNFNISLTNVANPTLTFNTNGGTCDVSSKSLAVGEVYGELPTPTRASEPLTMTSGGTTYSFSEIRTIAESNNADDYFDIGDVMSGGDYTFDGWYTEAVGGIKVTADTVMNDTDVTVYAHWAENKFEAAIADFNHDDLADGSGKAGITFSLVNCMSTKHRMNSTDTNVGGWEASEMRSYLSNDVYNGLSDDLKAAIKTVTKTTNAGNAQSTVTTTGDKLFLFSVDEVYGVSQSTNFQNGIGNGHLIECYYAESEAEGVQYPYFQISENVIKSVDGSTSSIYWLRSPDASDNNCFRITYFSCNNSYASNIRGVVFGFSI